jgi:hypothetical protein
MYSGHSCPPPLILGLIFGALVLLSEAQNQDKKRTKVSALHKKRANMATESNPGTAMQILANDRNLPPSFGFKTTTRPCALQKAE